MPDDDTTYNGWTNRATWLVALHLSNDPALHDNTGALVLGALPDEVDDVYATHASVGLEPPTKPEARRMATARIGERVKGYVDEVVGLGEAHDPGALFAADLIGTALADVDWTEVADGYVDDYYVHAGLYDLRTCDTCARIEDASEPSGHDDGRCSVCDPADALETDGPVLTAYALDCGHVAEVPGPHGATSGRAWCPTCVASAAVVAVVDR